MPETSGDVVDMEKQFFSKRNDMVPYMVPSPLNFAHVALLRWFLHVLCVVCS